MTADPGTPAFHMPAFRLLDQCRHDGSALLLDINNRQLVAKGGTSDDLLVTLPGIANSFPVAARFGGSPNQVLVHTEDPSETALLYTVHRDPEVGHWGRPEVLGLPAGCVPLDLSGGDEGGIVARHLPDVGGTELCWYDGRTGKLKVLQRESGWIYGAALSLDRASVAFLVGGPVSLSATLWLSDVEGVKPARRLHPPDGYAALGLPNWTADGGGLVFCSTYQREFAAVLMLDPATGTSRELLATDHDLEVRVLDGDDRLLIIENRDGVSALSLMHPANLVPPLPLTLPGPGVAFVSRRPALGPQGELLITFAGPGRPSGVWNLHPDREPRPHTPAVAADQVTRPGRFYVTAADSVRVPVLDWFPDRDNAKISKVPVVVVLHGGPEEQWLLRHEPRFEFLRQRGFAVLAADLRGSLGFGMTYSCLDDGILNFDVLLDLAAVHAGLAGRGLDPRRAVLLGTSFGAYQVLLALAHQPELWAAGIAVSGVSDPLAYLSQTQPHRRGQRQLAYGSPETDGHLMARMSPLTGAAKITAPLLLVHGTRDGRVPVQQSRALAHAIHEAGGRVVLQEFPDEGHRFTDPRNTAALDVLIADFLQYQVEI